MKPLRREWAVAFLHQGRSDLRVFDLLASQREDQYPRCHALHYLQMACEKIAKAYRIRDTNAELHGEGGLLRKHVGFEKFLRAFLLSPAIQTAYAGRTAQLRQTCKTLLALAREIEKLAPAVGRETAPENTEYPWATPRKVIAPCHHDFSRLSLLREPGGTTFLKLLRRAVNDFALD